MNGTSRKTSAWKGFEFQPQGCLLEQFIEESPRIGIAYERSCEFYKDYHTHDRLLLVFPRGSCKMRVTTRTPKGSYVVDSGQCLMVPAALEHDDEGISSIYDTLALLPETVFVENLARTHSIPENALNRFLTACTLATRSARLEHLIQEYFFERVVAKKRDSEDCLYLERKIIAELFSAALNENPARAEPDPVKTESVAVKALKYIETNLFSELDSMVIAKSVGASVPTLFRDFKKQTGKSPYAYIKNRRLEEAMALLKKGDRSVGEVALLVGYENFGAFSEAFKSKYRKSPSSFLKAVDARS